ncbi:keywimysin-related RiPP [Thermoactinospora rubra]|nr:keywimysin-related RiPP [Thermoactinospora rubra]
MRTSTKARAYERPTLTAAGTFDKKTGIGISSGPDGVLLRKRL